MRFKRAIILPLTLALTACSEALPRVNLSGETVGAITLFAFNGDSERVPGTMNLGHAFVGVTNLTDEAYQVAGYRLQPQETVTIGSWSMSGHFGLWYNIENYYMNEKGRYEGRLSLDQDFSASALNAINEYLYDHDYWSLFKNCSYLALNLFNLCRPEAERLEVSGTVTPGKIYDLLLDEPEAEVDYLPALTGQIGWAEDDGKGEFIAYEGE